MIHAAFFCVFGLPSNVFGAGFGAETPTDGKLIAFVSYCISMVEQGDDNQLSVWRDKLVVRANQLFVRTLARV